MCSWETRKRAVTQGRVSAWAISEPRTSDGHGCAQVGKCSEWCPWGGPAQMWVVVQGLGDTGHPSLPSSQHGIHGSPPVGSTCLQRASGTRESLEAMGGGRLQASNNGDPKGDINDMLFPGLLCLSLSHSQRLFLLHSKYVCPGLPVDSSEPSPLSPEPAPHGLSPLPKSVPTVL